MKIIRSFSVPVTETDARQRATTFLLQAGYQPMPDTGDYLYFTRGSMSGAYASFNPTRWACTVYVSFVTEGAVITVNLVGLISSDPTEKRFAVELLTAEFNLLEEAVTKNESKTYDVSELKKKITAHVYRVVGMFASFLFITILAVITGLYTSINLSVSPLSAVAIAVGVFLLFGSFFLFFWKRQKKT